MRSRLKDDWQVVSLDSYSEAKYGCSPPALRQAMMAARPAADSAAE